MPHRVARVLYARDAPRLGGLVPLRAPLDLRELLERDERGHDELLELELARELTYLYRGDIGRYREIYGRYRGLSLSFSWRESSRIC